MLHHPAHRMARGISQTARRRQRKKFTRKKRTNEKKLITNHTNNEEGSICQLTGGALWRHPSRAFLLL